MVVQKGSSCVLILHVNALIKHLKAFERERDDQATLLMLYCLTLTLSMYFCITDYISYMDGKLESKTTGWTLQLKCVDKYVNIE